MPASAPANRLALRLIAAGAALLTAGAASAQPIRLPPLRPRSAPAAPAPAAPETAPATPAPLSPMQLSKALAKVSPNLPPPNLAAAVRLTWTRRPRPRPGSPRGGPPWWPSPAQATPGP